MHRLSLSNWPTEIVHLLNNVFSNSIGLKAGGLQDHSFMVTNNYCPPFLEVTLADWKIFEATASVQSCVIKKKMQRPQFSGKREVLESFAMDQHSQIFLSGTRMSFFRNTNYFTRKLPRTKSKLGQD